jgi:hypothetical protein
MYILNETIFPVEKSSKRLTIKFCVEAAEKRRYFVSIMGRAKEVSSGNG